MNDSKVYYLKCQLVCGLCCVALGDVGSSDGRDIDGSFFRHQQMVPLVVDLKIIKRHLNNSLTSLLCINTILTDFTATENCTCIGCKAWFDCYSLLLNVISEIIFRITTYFYYLKDFISHFHLFYKCSIIRTCKYKCHFWL